MAASVVLVTFLVLLSGGEPDQQVSESVADTPPVQKSFIEVPLDPVFVKEIDIAGDAAPAGLEDSVNEPSAETQEPIGKDVEPLDQIEPMFVEEVEMATDAETAVAESAPLDREMEINRVAEPSAESLDAGESTIVEQSIGDQNAPTAEPVAEPTQIVEPDLVAKPESVTIENTIIILVPQIGIIPVPQFEAVEETAGDPEPTSASAAAEPPPQVLDATEATGSEGETGADQGAVDNPVIGPNFEFGEPVEAPVEGPEPAVAEDADILTPPDENSNPVDNLLLDPFLAL